MHKLSLSGKIVQSLIIIIMIIMGFVTLLPFLHVVSKSFSSETAVVSGKVFFWPVGFQVETYQYVFEKGSFFNSFKISVFRTIFGTLFAMLLTAMTAYPLSKKGMRGRKVFLYLWIAVMLFRGGIIPNYILFKSLKLTNTVWSLILPQLINVFNLLVIKNYMESVPDQLDEAARIDGASNFRILFQIILPVCLPVLATIALFYAVDYWNDYFFAMLYVNDPGLKPLQQYLYDLITQSLDILNNGTEAPSVNIDDALNITPNAVRAAAIVASTVPILFVYPILQRYFIKGIVIGSVKE